MGRVPSGEVVYTNAAFREVLGIEPPEGAVRGAFVEPYGVHTSSGAPYPEDRMPFEQCIAARKTVVVDDLVIHRHDGRRVSLRVFAKPIFDADGVMTHVLEAFTDISRETDAERARAERERRLEAIGQLVTGSALDDEAKSMLELGIRGFLAKPYDDTQLVRGLESLGVATTPA